MRSFRSFRAVLLSLAAVSTSQAADDKLGSLTKAVTSFKLSNGAQFLVVERPYSPFVAFHLRVRAGIADEPSGRGGLAAMALLNFLQGSESYGTRNQTAEKASLAEAEKLLDVSNLEAAKGDQADEVKKGHADYQARSSFEEANTFAVRPRFFEGVLLENGLTGFELRPMADFSDIAMTLSSQRAELWFRMVAGWLQAPSSRFFMQNRTSVSDQRERAAKTGAIQRERAFGAAFSLHPYHAISAGDGELNGASPAELRAFMKTHYIPSNLTIAMVGDIAVPEAKRLAELYFGKLPAAAPPEIRGAEMLKLDSPQPVRLALTEDPMFAAGWPRPAASDPSDPVFDMLQAILGGGNGSLLHNELMVETRSANRIQIHARYPGARYSGLFVIEAEPLPTRSYEDVEAGIFKVIQNIAKNGVSIPDLEQARLWWRLRLLGEARTAAGRAQQLVRLHTEYGTVKVEERLSKLESVTAEDCKRVTAEYLSARPYVSIIQMTAVAGSNQ